LAIGKSEINEWLPPAALVVINGKPVEDISYWHNRHPLWNLPSEKLYSPTANKTSRDGRLIQDNQDDSIQMAIDGKTGLIKYLRHERAF